MDRAGDDHIIRQILAAVGTVIGRDATAAIIAQIHIANSVRVPPPQLLGAITRIDLASSAPITLDADATQIANWLAQYDIVSVGLIADLFRDFGLIAADGRGLLALHGAVDAVWSEVAGFLLAEPQPGTTLTQFEFGPGAQDVLRFTGAQIGAHAAALHDRMQD